jgi:hypothetical protein
MGQDALATCKTPPMWVRTIQTTGNATMRSQISSDGARPPPAFLPPDGTHWAWKSRAREPVAQTGDSETAREGIWIFWCECKAREMNRLFQEHGLMGQPGQIKPETSGWHGTRDAAGTQAMNAKAQGTRILVSHIYSEQEKNAKGRVIPLKIRRDKPRNLSDHRRASFRRDGSGSRPRDAQTYPPQGPLFQSCDSMYGNVWFPSSTPHLQHVLELGDANTDNLFVTLPLGCNAHSLAY